MSLFLYLLSYMEWPDDFLVIHSIGLDAESLHIFVNAAFYLYEDNYGNQILPWRAHCRTQTSKNCTR